MKLRAEQAEQQKKDKAQEDEQKRIHELVDLTAKVNALGGIWKSDPEVNAGLAKIRAEGGRGMKGKMTEALKTQFSFRKRVLRQHLSDSKLWSFSEKGRAFDVDELSRKLKLIIAESPAFSTSPSEDTR